MEEDFKEELKDVFKLCGPDEQGFILIDRFTDLAKSHFTTSTAKDEDWIKIIAFLKSGGKQRIDFSQFCTYINDILALQGSPSSDNYRSSKEAYLGKATNKPRESGNDRNLLERDGAVKVQQLREQLTELLEIKKESDYRQIKMKEENFLLLERLQYFEEHVRETNHCYQTKIEEQKKRNTEQLERIEKENSTDIEILIHNIESIQKECLQLKREMLTLGTDNAKLLRNHERLCTERENLTEQLEEMHKKHESLRENLHCQHSRMVHDQKIHQQLIQELTEELEELRLFKEDGYRLISKVGIELSSDIELEDHIKQLQKENVQLHNEREELQTEFVHQHVEAGRLLLSHSSLTSSIELEELPTDKVIKVLQKEVEANAKLQEYVELITLRILDKNPSILEIDIKSS